MPGSTYHTGDGDVASEAESHAARMIALCRAMTDSSPLPLVMTEGPRHVIGCASLAFAELVGCELPALLGCSVDGCLADVGAEQLQLLFDQVYATSVPLALSERPHQHPRRGAVSWTYTIWPILGDTAAPLGLLLEVHDATAQQLSQHVVSETQAINEQLLLAGLREQALAEQLQRQLAFISAITRSLGEGVYAFDRTGRVTYANPTAARLLGCLEDELLGREASAVLRPPALMSPSASDPDPFLEVLRTGTAYRTDGGSARHNDGHTFPITYTIAPIVDGGEVVGAVVVFRDLTEIRHLEATREEYLALLSHDLRTPLTAILGYAQRLDRKLGREGNENGAAQAQTIVESSRRMARMLEHVLERSALEAGASALRREPLDLAELVRRMVAQLPPLPDPARIRLELVDALPLVGDQERLERVLVNLLTNALKYSGPDSPVFVRLAVVEGQALISVQDQGVGIASEELPQLFVKHYRARSAGLVEGLGLGLYSSQLVVAAHGGRMWVESELGRGSTFMLTLPLDKEVLP